MSPLGWFFVGFLSAFIVITLGAVVSSTMLSSKISREEEKQRDWWNPYR
jgi:hypothetical protein